MITPKTILLTGANIDSQEVATYALADEIVQRIAVGTGRGPPSQIRVVVVFADLFVWTTTLSVEGSHAEKRDFVQRAIQAEWEFNAGVRPAWWPCTTEADRMWGVHYREDRDNGRAELARMRLERYELRPVRLSELPARNAEPLPPTQDLMSSR